jgi:signal transduction histidine kinase
VSIKQLLTIATGVIALLLITSAVFALWVFSNAENRLARALYSYEQLSIATGLETDAALSLLAEAQRRQGFDPEAPLLVDRDGVDAALEALIARIRDEIDSISDPAEQAVEEAEFLAAYAIRDHYSSLEAALERPVDASTPVDQRALASFVELDAQLAGVIRDEREEVETALAELVAFRGHLRSYAAAATAILVFAIIACAIFIYRALMRPLQALDAGSRALAAGNIAHRIEVRRPPELRQLAVRLNDMASRLEKQRNALRETNDRLEQTVTERTAQLAEKAERLQAIDDSRRLFFAKVGHELRTPLTVLLGETELALGNRTNDARIYREALQHIGANGEHLKRRIENLMAVARSEDGRLQIARAPTDLLDLAQATLDHLRGYAGSNEITLRLLSTLDTPLCAEVDAEWLKQALMALIDNAIKFSPAGSEVELNVCSDGEEAVLSIADRGAGVTEEDLPHLALPYFQGDAGPHRAGTGLGLTVAHWVTEQHGGHISAHNRDGGGLCVALHIPLC